MCVCSEVPLAQTSFLWMTMHGHIGLLLLRSCWKVKMSLEWIASVLPRLKYHRTCVGCFGETYCRSSGSSLHHPENTQQLKQMLIEEWALLPQEMLQPAGSEYAETVRSNHCSEGRAYTILRNICLLFFLLDRPS
ncbi:hypothetical protein TNCV_1016601 [Trichonephila clavipes]|uniref:Uncharacterized protein n=1 Tax=Trichonephila clavipes TaxID=2585209 RepID=A0A8X6VY71_TRICX|nr:hypothetical protein TNCV_1016601 [Trichonephila clavipes]